MAKNGAKLDRITLQHHFNSRASQPDSLSHAAPICSPELAKDLGGLVFAPKHRDDLQSGLSIFAVSHPDQDSARRASELAGHYDSQMTGATACMSFADSIALKSAQDLKLPSRFLQLQAILRAYHTVLEVVLGIGHCVPLALGAFLRRFDKMQLQLDVLLDGKLPECSGVLRFVHLKMTNWFNAQVSAHDDVPPPSFGDLLDEVEEDRWVPPRIPPAYLTLGGKTPPTRLRSPAGTTPLLPPGSVGTFKVEAALLDPKVPIRTNFVVKDHMKAHGDPPLNDSGGQMCLCFHVRGRCKHECERGVGAKSDHKRHSAAESTRLLAYLNLATPAPAGGN
jgi:hypothetical protein